MVGLGRNLPLGWRVLREMAFAIKGRVYAERWEHSVASVPLNHRVASELSPNPLKTYFDGHASGKGIWKWNHYFDIYHRHFQRFVGHEVHILEIGIHSGGSLEMWREYFGPGCRVYGVDKEQACTIYENEWTKVFIGDQGDREFWQAFKKQCPRIDVVVDDGGHQTEQQQVTLEEMLPHLSAGGVFLCEDIGGHLNHFYSYLCGLGSGLNTLGSEFTQDGVDTKKDLISYSTPFQSAIKSIHLYPFVAVIEKAEHPTDRFTAPKQGSEWVSFS
jgi:hypothetical protein